MEIASANFRQTFNFQIFRFIAMLFLEILLPGKIQAVNYVWNSAASTTWSNPNAWLPVGVPGAGDAVLFANGSNVTVSSVPAISLSEFKIKSGTQITLKAASAGTLTISGGGAAPHFEVEFNSTLKIASATALSILLSNGAMGAVGGDIWLLEGAHRLNAAAAGAIVFQGASNFYAGSFALTGFSGNPFTAAGTANVVVFENGASYWQNEGSHPFGLGQPSSKVVFQPGSDFYWMLGTTASPTFAGRTYGNFYLGNGSTVSTSATANWTVNGNLTIESGSYLSLDGSGTAIFTIGGDIFADDDLSLYAGSGGIVFSAGTEHNIDGFANLITLSKIVIPATASVFLVRDIENSDFGTNPLPTGIELDGTLNMAQAIITGSGAMRINASGKLHIGHVSGLNGNVQSSGSHNFSPEAHYVFDGLAPQICGTMFPETVGTLEIQNPTTFSKNVSASQKLDLQDVMTTGAFKATVPSNSLLLANGGWVNGNLELGFAVGSNVQRVFEIGNATVSAAGEIIFQNISTAGWVTASTTASDHPQIATSNFSPNQTVNRHWKFSGTGISFDNYFLNLEWNAAAENDPAFNFAAAYAGHFSPAASPNWVYPPVAAPTVSSIQILDNAYFDDFQVGSCSSGAMNFYADADGDTFGDANGMPVLACSAPSGYVSNSTDCNDSNADVNPGETETCNGTDNNCSGDENDASDQTTFFADADSDSFGNANASQSACYAPNGFVSNATDCNDSNADVNPGETETCNGTDNNCSGDENDASDQTTFFADADGDSFGNANASQSACYAPNGFVQNATDCNDGSENINPAATEICGNGTDENCDTHDGIASFSLAIVKQTTACLKFDASISNVVGAAPGNLLYSKDGGTTYQSSPVFLNLVPSAYVFAVKDATNCVKTQSQTINAPMTLGTTGDTLACFGDLNGEVSVSINNGFPDYFVEWKKGTVTVGTGETLGGLGAATYKAYVTDSKGCQKISGNVIVGQPAKLASVLTAVAETCFDENDGQVQNAMSGGTMPYLFSWASSADVNFSASTEDLNNLPAPATYFVSIVDQNGCTLQKSAFVKGVAAPLVITSLTVKNVACFGGSNGSATAKTSGGNTGNKTFTWSNGAVGSNATTHTASNLPGGPISVSVTDAQGCMASGGPATITAPTTALSLNLASVTPTGTTYRVVTTATGGFTPYKFRRSLNFPATSWSAPGTGTFLNVPPGNYTFQVNDGGGAFSTSSPKGCIVGADFSIPPTVLVPPTSLTVRMDEGAGILDFDLEPNPAKGLVFLRFQDRMPSFGTVEILDARGSSVRQIPVLNFENSACRISLEGLPAGIFFVRFWRDGGGVASKCLFILD